MQLTSVAPAAAALLSALLIQTTVAADDTAFITALPHAGAATSDVYPPEGTTVDPELFPPESKVGFPGPTPTGVQPAAIQTAATYPHNRGPSNQFPLVAPRPHGNSVTSDEFDITKYWGNLSPWYSLSSADYGLPDTSPLAPPGCSVTQVHLLYRHGARYPTSDADPAQFASKIANATEKGFEVRGDLTFLSDWTYKLGGELLTPFGRSQEFLLGIQHRQLYGHLLNNFTEAGTIPVFRTESQDRMVKTTENFAAGFFGVPEYLDQVNIEILVESPGVNNSGAPYYVCDNANVASRGYIGTAMANRFAKNAFNTTIARLNSQISGVEFTVSDVISMLQLCSYETVALGYSAFCPLFTQEDFLNYEYFYDLEFYYECGPGSPVSAAQGKGYLQEFVARFTGEYPQPSSALNETFDNSTTYFPLNQSIYADATHEVVVLDTLVAFNLTALFKGPPLSAAGNQRQNSFSSSKLVPFATHFTVQVLECPAYQPTKQMRFIINDAVVPVADSYPGCPADPHGLCSFDNVVSVLKDRIDEIDFNYDCFADYEAEEGVDYNGRAPRS
ncbi:phosphoglycerate mutase-like protein [Hypoxylon fragiforme]|uniref:phosphoglycerate mutase-like protein n=1 Tax=Hypoxylon fragiforme TaxID=63214 RepID=UPI0020C5E155|nr:phosphoglycerate mutase-like protein [Hypoxylon fragiforme]KAI2610212.1 phosphoglycerate mutase-like protein [Hypoxylon fragiforme]